MGGEHYRPALPLDTLHDETGKMRKQIIRTL